MKLSYLLITAAYNEETTIEKTILSVISQTILPLKWVIVSDGSTDKTDNVIKKYIEKNKWIEFIRMPEHNDRNFAAKARAFNTGYTRVSKLSYDVIGNIDADISFENDYVEYLLEKFKNDPSLGVAGTHYTEGKFHSFKNSFINIHHVNGQCQLFRKKCFEEIGGYKPIKYGGIDWIAVTTARMNGWKTFSFGDKVFVHHRKMGTAQNSLLKFYYNYGKKDYLLGSHPLWELFRGIFQTSKKPFLIGGLYMLFGYIWAAVRCIKRPVSDELMRFYRKEQLQRLKYLFLNKFDLSR